MVHIPNTALNSWDRGRPARTPILQAGRPPPRSNHPNSKACAMNNRPLLCSGRFLAVLSTIGALGFAGEPPPEALRNLASAALKKAATYYHANVASHGGYVYYYSVDLQQRWGE